MQNDKSKGAEGEGAGGSGASAGSNAGGLLRKESRMGKIRAVAIGLATERKIPLMETSARTSEGVDAVFLTIAARYLAYRNSAQGRSARRKNNKGRGGGNARDGGGRGTRPSKLTSGRNRPKKKACC